MYPEATPRSFLAAAALILRAVNHGQRRGNVTLRSNADRNFEFACFVAVAYQGLCSAIEGGVTLCLMDCRVCTEPKLPPKPHHSRASTPKCSPFHCVGLHIQQLTGTILESTLKASNQSLHNLQLLIDGPLARQNLFLLENLGYVTQYLNIQHMSGNLSFTF